MRNPNGITWTSAVTNLLLMTRNSHPQCERWLCCVGQCEEAMTNIEHATLKEEGLTHTHTHTHLICMLIPGLIGSGSLRPLQAPCSPHFAMHLGLWSTSLLHTVTHKHTDWEAPLIVKNNALQPTNRLRLSIDNQPAFPSTKKISKSEHGGAFLLLLRIWFWFFRCI